MTPVEKDEPIGTGPPGRWLVGRALGPYQVVALLGAGAWARSTARATRASGATSP